mmetsp:Transcript_14666/g.43020  ORF Transcript_14666/g.43020 Transcript_14666/m.43020 type:complete len:320 (+) Transcript_14666:355-1314(+)
MRRPHAAGATMPGTKFEGSMPSTSTPSTAARHASLAYHASSDAPKGSLSVGSAAASRASFFARRREVRAHTRTPVSRSAARSTAALLGAAPLTLRAARTASCSASKSAGFICAAAGSGLASMRTLPDMLLLRDLMVAAKVVTLADRRPVAERSGGRSLRGGLGGGEPHGGTSGGGGGGGGASPLGLLANGTGATRSDRGVELRDGPDESFTRGDETQAGPCDAGAPSTRRAETAMRPTTSISLPTAATRMLSRSPPKTRSKAVPLRQRRASMASRGPCGVSSDHARRARRTRMSGSDRPAAMVETSAVCATNSAVGASG